MERNTSSEKTIKIKLEISEVTIPPRPRVVPRRKTVPKIEVIQTEAIKSIPVSVLPRPRPRKQRVMKPIEVFGIPVSLPPTIAHLPVLTRVVPEIHPEKPETIEEFHIRVIRPTNRNQAEQAVKEALESITTDVMAILTYIDDSTFAYLDFIPKSVGLRILTSVIDKENTARRAARLQKRSRKSLEVVKLTFIEDNKEKPLLHERWLSDGKIFIDFGTDLKIRALGAKQHTITIDPADRRKSQINNFDWYWRSNEKKLSQIFNRKVLKKVFFS